MGKNIDLAISFIPLVVIAFLLGVYLNQSLTAAPVASAPLAGGKILTNPGVLQLSNFEVCSSNCGYPSPFIEGEIAVNYSSAVTSMQLLVNGQGNPPRNFTGTPSPSDYIYLLKGSPPFYIVSGDNYNLTFVIGFADGKLYSASINVNAD